MDRLTLPIAEPGMRIGLFGGSFNPAHEGHRLVALECLKRLALDKVWLLVTPANPLKSRAELAPLDERLAGTVKVMDDPRLEVTGFESLHHFSYTWETLRFLTTTHPAVRFVWIMGADSLQNFDQWERWRDIAEMLPMAVYARPGAALRATSSPAGTALAAARLPEEQATRLADAPPPRLDLSPRRDVDRLLLGHSPGAEQGRDGVASDAAASRAHLGGARTSMLRHALPIIFVLTLAAPAVAQATFTVGVGSADGSSATFSVQQTPPGLAGDFAGAVVLSGVNIRTAPSSKAQITGTLHDGGTVMARCQRGWCELQDGGYVGQKFLSFTATGSFDVVQTPSETAALDSTTTLAPPGMETAIVAANFAGAWTVTNDPSQKAVPLALTQTGASVTGTMTGPSRVTAITGDIQGSKLSFTYQMADAKGAQVATGNGFLNLGKDGQSLTGALMLNGLVVSNINAVR